MPSAAFSGVVTREYDGKTYSAKYVVGKGDLITVSCELGTKVTQLGGSTAPGLAGLLLSELIAEANQNKDK